MKYDAFRTNSEDMIGKKVLLNNNPNAVAYAGYPAGTKGTITAVRSLKRR